MSASVYIMVQDDIGMYEARRRSLMRELHYLKKMSGPKELTGVDYSEEKEQGQHYDTYYVMDRIIKINAELDYINKILAEKHKIKKEIEDKLSELEGINYKVMYYKQVKGLKLKEVAEKLGYSEQYIREVNAKNNLQKTY